MRKKLFSVLLVLLLLIPAGCGTVPTPSEGKTVICTNFAAYDFSRALCENTSLSVSLLIPPGKSTHSYEPTAQDMISLQSCSLFVCVGGENDAWVDRVLAALPDSVTTFRMMNCVALVEEEIVEGMEAEEEEDEDEVEWDEHVWTSPRNAMQIVRDLSDTCAQLSPDDRTILEQNRDAYLSQLDQLDGNIRDALSSASRTTLVFADRFPARYFTEEYRLSYFAAFPGCSADSEPSAATIAFLIDKIRQEDIPVVFTVELSSQKIADSICSETGCQKLLFHTCHNVSLDEWNSGATYLSLMEQNISALKTALGCAANNKGN